MAGSPTCLTVIYILWQLTGSAASGPVKELVGSVGGAVTFPLESEVKQVDSIVWTFNTTPLVTAQPGDLGTHPGKEWRAIGRVSTSGCPSSFAEHLSKPKVTMGLQSNENGTCVTNLTCCMEHGEEDVIYTWKALGQEANESHNGPILPISWRWGESDMAFICVARNPVSSNFSSPILARKLCGGAADDPDSSMVLLCLLLVPLLLSLFVLGLFLWFLKRERQEENDPKGRSSKYGLFYCGNTKKDGKSPLTAHDARHTKAICL
uniref:SLAM family member 7 n=1 Tax=Nomascus leucogenys TaxID=61853 RepID=A0A2I3H9Z9_NOMLE